jgi:hypothetical protein
MEGRTVMSYDHRKIAKSLHDSVTELVELRYFYKYEKTRDDIKLINEPVQNYRVSNGYAEMLETYIHVADNNIYTCTQILTPSIFAFSNAMKVAVNHYKESKNDIESNKLDLLKTKRLDIEISDKKLEFFKLESVLNDFREIVVEVINDLTRSGRQENDYISHRAMGENQKLLFFYSELLNELAKTMEKFNVEESILKVGFLLKCGGCGDVEARSFFSGIATNEFDVVVISIPEVELYNSSLPFQLLHEFAHPFIDRHVKIKDIEETLKRWISKQLTTCLIDDFTHISGVSFPPDVNTDLFEAVLSRVTGALSSCRVIDANIHEFKNNKIYQDELARNLAHYIFGGTHNVDDAIAQRLMGWVPESWWDKAFPSTPPKERQQIKDKVLKSMCESVCGKLTLSDKMSSYVRDVVEIYVESASDLFASKHGLWIYPYNEYHMNTHSSKSIWDRFCKIIGDPVNFRNVYPDTLLGKTRFSATFEATFIRFSYKRAFFAKVQKEIDCAVLDTDEFKDIRSDFFDSNISDWSAICRLKKYIEPARLQPLVDEYSPTSDRLTESQLNCAASLFNLSKENTDKLAEYFEHYEERLSDFASLREFLRGFEIQLHDLLQCMSSNFSIAELLPKANDILLEKDGSYIEGIYKALSKRMATEQNTSLPKIP